MARYKYTGFLERSERPEFDVDHLPDTRTSVSGSIATAVVAARKPRGPTSHCHLATIIDTPAPRA